MAMRLRDRMRENRKVRLKLKFQGKSNFLISMTHAVDGIVYTIKHERNFKIELIMMIMVLVAGIYFKISNVEWLVLFLTISGVITLEMVNTGIERCVDLVTKDYHELAKIAKDVSAGAVLVMSMFSVCIGILIFLPRIVEMFR